jgi:hypothetical protein
VYWIYGIQPARDWFYATLIFVQEFDVVHLELTSAATPAPNIPRQQRLPPR